MGRRPTKLAKSRGLFFMVRLGLRVLGGEKDGKS
jgi:hypothetical protein